MFLAEQNLLCIQNSNFQNLRQTISDGFWRAEINENRKGASLKPQEYLRQGKVNLHMPT